MTEEQRWKLQYQIETDRNKCLKGIWDELKRIADGIHGDILEPEEVYSEDTLNLLKNSCMTSKEAQKILDKMCSNNFSPPEGPEWSKKN